MLHNNQTNMPKACLKHAFIVPCNEDIALLLLEVSNILKKDVA